MGSQGSIEFVQRFLVPKIMRRFNQTEISGAFILDTIMNFNSTEGSQKVPSGLGWIDHEAAGSIEIGNYRGDFLAMFQRRDCGDGLIGEIFKK